MAGKPWRRMVALVAVTLGLVTTVPAWSAPWTTAPPQARQAGLRAGRTVHRYPSPTGAAVLLVRDEGEHGDYAHFPVYLQLGRSLTRLFTVTDAQLQGVLWDAKAGTVGFLAKEAPDWGKIDEIEVVVTLRDQTCRKRVRKTSQAEPAG
jgi:hypothetical protein